MHLISSPQPFCSLCELCSAVICRAASIGQSGVTPASDWATRHMEATGASVTLRLTQASVASHWSKPPTQTSDWLWPSVMEIMSSPTEQHRINKNDVMIYFLWSIIAFIIECLLRSCFAYLHVYDMTWLCLNCLVVLAIFVSVQLMLFRAIMFRLGG